ncbi:MAG: phage N-6-adenine-methyltransferase [Rikenellaceae bacterium]|nr:phage N-6-adenine-methyltransferase [Rikenellaceae bacterium]
MAISDEWYTPPEIIRSLGEFDLDPASCKEAYDLNHSAKEIYTKEDNGLVLPWHGRIWLNPPYSNPLIQRFLEKMSLHNKGIALTFSKIEAKWFHDIVLAHATAIKFLYDRVRFLRADGTRGLQPRNGSMLIAYGNEDAEILSANTIKGKFINLKNN